MSQNLFWQYCFITNLFTVIWVKLEGEGGVWTRTIILDSYSCLSNIFHQSIPFWCLILFMGHYQHHFWYHFPSSLSPFGQGWQVRLWEEIVNAILAKLPIFLYWNLNTWHESVSIERIRFWKCILQNWPYWTEIWW